MLKSISEFHQTFCLIHTKHLFYTCMYTKYTVHDKHSRSLPAHGKGCKGSGQ